MFKKIFSVLSSAALAAALLSAVPVSAAELDNSDKTAQEVVDEMGIGINLGNTFEACGSWINKSSVSNFETAWGSPIITEAMIKGYADAGFKTLRIPVAWSNMMDSDYKIDQAYIDRVKEVTQWAIDADMYVIVNEHWDSGWIEEYPENKDEVMEHYSSIWVQVADAFKDFDDHLILESQNEELGNWPDLWNRWGGTEGKEEAYQYALDFNQTFVDVVRKSGGNNDDRLLLISGIITDIDLTCDPLFEMPEDPADMMAVSVHYYTPWNFAGGNDKYWGDLPDYAELNKYMNMLKERFVDNDIPVIIGEACNGSEIHNKVENSARKYFAETCREAYERGMCPVLWDITYAENQPVDNQIYNRRTQELTDPELGNELADIVAAGQKKIPVIDAEDITIKYGEKYIPDFSADCGSVSYQIADDTDIIEFDDGDIVALKPGSVKLYVFTLGDDEYAEAFKEITVTVEKGEIPVKPDKEIVVYGDQYKSCLDVELPEGWSWNKAVDLVDGETVEALASYVDKKNYLNPTMNISITWYKDVPADESSSKAADESKSSSTSSAKAAEAETKTTASASTVNAATGAAAATSALAVTVLAAAAAIVIKKKQK